MVRGGERDNAQIGRGERRVDPRDRRGAGGERPGRGRDEQQLEEQGHREGRRPAPRADGGEPAEGGDGEPEEAERVVHPAADGEQQRQQREADAVSAGGGEEVGPPPQEGPQRGHPARGGDAEQR
ncbi:MAG: hypothetical protein ACK559_30195, partial [bacterium]